MTAQPASITPAPLILPDDIPYLPRGVRLADDRVRGIRVLQAPERAMQLDAIGDAILSRRGMGTSYHLAVVVDDADQGITVVTRGKDLFDSTYIHVLLQKLLQLPTPLYHHHRLIRDDAGKRLAKRDDARAIRHYREDGATPQDIRGMLAL